MKEPIIHSRLNTESLWVLNNREQEPNPIQIIVLGGSQINTLGWDEQLNDYKFDENGKRYIKILTHIIEHYPKTLLIIHGGDTIGPGLKLKNKEEKEKNMQAFIFTTKKILYKHNIPMFASIGDADFIQQGTQYSPKLFQDYIGNLFNDIFIPKTKLHFLSIPIYYFEKCKPPYFEVNDLERMHKTLTQKRQIYYLIDFHAPLFIRQMNSSDELFSLSEKQTETFLSKLQPNVLGVMSHHNPVGKLHYLNQHDKIIPYIEAGAAGNPKSPFWPNYYLITIEDGYSDIPTITSIEGVRVPNLM